MENALKTVALHVERHLNPHATFEQVESAIRGLDGVHRTLIVVELEPGPRLTIAGGPERFVSELAEDDVHRWAVIDPRAGDDLVDLVAGGQAVEYPARLCVDRESVVEAARTFVIERGARSERLTWSVET